MSRPRECPTCRRVFTPVPKHPRQTYCSVACAVRRGVENNRHNGGLCIRDDGRCVIYCRDGSLLYYYRAVMAAHIGRLLTADELIHHRNGDATDDRVENLEIVTRAAHMDLHRGDLLRGRRAA